MLVTFLPHIPKLLATASKSGLVNAKSECLPSKPFCCFHLINPYSMSSQTIATMFNGAELQLEILHVHHDPASPEIDRTRRSGKAIFAPMEPGMAKPMAETADIRQVFCSTHWKYQVTTSCAPTSDVGYPRLPRPASRPRVFFEVSQGWTYRLFRQQNLGLVFPEDQTVF